MNITAQRIPAAVLVIAAFFMGAAMAHAQSHRLYIGTYTRGESRGIYVAELDTRTGKLSQPRLAAETPNPSFLAIAANGQRLYAANEVGQFNGEKTGSVTAFAIDPTTGDLEQLNAQSSGGTGPCYVAVAPANVFVANYGGGSVARLPLDKRGALGQPTAVVQHEGNSVNERRQEAPHAHSINVDPSGKFAIAADLGIDKLLVYTIDADGSLTPHDPPFTAVAPGAGPRHLAFAPIGKIAYVVNELSRTVTAYTWDAEGGTLTELQSISAVPDDVTEGTSAEVLVHPSGEFLYASNRGSDTIAVFAIDADTGKLTSTGHVPSGGKQPRHFAVDPTGRFMIVAHQVGDSIVVFRINDQTGVPEPTGQTIALDSPVCVKFVPGQ